MKIKCKIEGCKKDVYSRELCNSHYKKELNKNKKCEIAGCTRQHYARKRCYLHYYELTRTEGGIRSTFGKSKAEIQQKKRCLAKNCNRLSKYKGYCTLHYNRLKKNNSLNLKSRKKKDL